MGLIASYNLRSMIVRKGTAAMTAGGIAMVVAVFVMTLAIAQGFRQTLVSSGSPQNAIILRKSATAETVSAVLRSDVPIVEALPQVARGADGQPLASPKLIRFTELTEDEYFCNEEGAKSGVTFENTSETEPLVCLRYFGPEVNPDAPAMGAYKKNRFN